MTAARELLIHPFPGVEQFARQNPEHAVVATYKTSNSGQPAKFQANQFHLTYQMPVETLSGRLKVATKNMACNLVFVTD